MHEPETKRSGAVPAGAAQNYGHRQPLEVGRPGPAEHEGRAIFSVSIAFVVLAIATIILYASQDTQTFFTVVAGALSLGTAAFLVGALTGFLFGIPRVVAAAAASRSGDEVLAPAMAPSQSRGGISPNTNLEQISDWLTKILVGVGLTQVGELPGALARLATGIAPLLGDRADSGVFGAATAVYAVAGGFLVGYLYTRLQLGGAFREADLESKVSAIEAEFGQTVGMGVRKILSRAS